MRARNALVTSTAALLLLFAGIAAALQSPLDDGKRAYLEGRFEDSMGLLQPLLQTASEAGELREITFFLGLNQLALGNPSEGEAMFQSAVRHDPQFEPGESLFSPDIVNAYAGVRSGLVGRLTVDSTPSGATVTLGGVAVGATPYQGAALSGEQMVGISFAGYASEQRSVNVSAGEDTSVTVTLQASGTTASRTGSAEETSSEGGGGSGKTIAIVAGAGGAAALGLAAASGGGDSSPTVTTPVAPVAASRGVFSAAINPSTINSAPSSNPNFPFEADFTVVITESAGLGGNVDFINVTLTNSSGASTSAINFGAGDIISRAGSNRVESRSQGQFPLGVVYRFTTGQSSGSLSVSIQVTDDRGNQSRLSASANLR